MLRITAPAQIATRAPSHRAVGGLGITVRSRLAVPETLVWRRQLFGLPALEPFPVTLLTQATRTARVSSGFGRSSVMKSPRRCPLLPPAGENGVRLLAN